MPIQFSVRFGVLDMNVRMLMCGKLRRCVLAVRVVMGMRSADVRIHFVRGARQHASSQVRVPLCRLPLPIPVPKRVLTTGAAKIELPPLPSMGAPKIVTEVPRLAAAGQNLGLSGPQPATMGSIGGAVLAGLLVGVVVSMTSLFAPEMAKVSIFALMAVVLIVRPQGFFGRAGLMS